MSKRIEKAKIVAEMIEKKLAEIRGKKEKEITHRPIKVQKKSQHKHGAPINVIWVNTQFTIEKYKSKSCPDLIYYGKTLKENYFTEGQSGKKSTESMDDWQSCRSLSDLELIEFKSCQEFTQADVKTKYFPKSSTLLEPSKFLTEFDETKTHVGPIEGTTCGSSKMSPSTSQWHVNITYPTASVGCPKCNETVCGCIKETLSSYDNDIYNRAATIINAAARGFLVRRLMRTRRVERCINDIGTYLDLHFSITENPEKDTEDFAVVHLQAMSGLIRAYEEFDNIFYKMTKLEQLQIIDHDRIILSEELID